MASDINHIESQHEQRNGLLSYLLSELYFYLNWISTFI
jgi:hypothetical protein